MIGKTWPERYAMRWHSLNGRFTECPVRPFLLDEDAREAAASLSSLKFETMSVQVATCETEREIVRAIGKAIGLPDEFRGGWDAFVDLLQESVVEAGRLVVIGIVDADELARKDMRT